MNYMRIRFEIEDEAGAEGAIAGSCTDGWDSPMLEFLQMVVKHGNF